MAGEILGMDGKAILPEQKTIPAVQALGVKYPLRMPDPEVMFKKDPKDTILDLCAYIRDLNNILYVGMTQLARDIYARQPVGPRHFKKFAEDLGLQLVDVRGAKAAVSDEVIKR